MRTKSECLHGSIITLAHACIVRVTDEVKPQFAGHVVAVVERMPGQLFSGTLGLLRPSSAATKEKQEAERREREGDRGDEPRRPIDRPKIVWFKPTDKRVPLIAIPTEQAPPDFVQNSEAYANKLFVACIKRHVRLFTQFGKMSCTEDCFSRSVLSTLSVH